MRGILKINDFKARARLGCEPWEIATPQGVAFSVEFQYSDLPKACFTDELEDAICYAKVCNLIREISEAREYKLIEHLAHLVYLALREDVPRDVRLKIALKKEKPPVDGLCGGSEFVIED